MIYEIVGISKLKPTREPVLTVFILKMVLKTLVRAIIILDWVLMVTRWYMFCSHLFLKFFDRVFKSD